MQYYKFAWWETSNKTVSLNQTFVETEIVKAIRTRKWANITGLQLAETILVSVKGNPRCPRWIFVSKTWANANSQIVYVNCRKSTKCIDIYRITLQCRSLIS